MVFMSRELDEDGEIPIGFEQRKKRLLAGEDIFKAGYARMTERELDSMIKEEDLDVEEEYRRIHREGGFQSGALSNDSPGGVHEGRSASGKNSGIHTKRELEMAKAYGGKPKKGGGHVRKRTLERKPTDKLFPGLDEEEESSHKKEKSFGNEFRERLVEMERFRQKEREALRGNQALP